MVKIKDAKTTSKNVVEGVIRAYIEGKGTLNWVINEIQGENLSKEELKEIFNKVYSYSKANHHFQELQNKLVELELI